MARRVFLHVGAPKSGTTFLQSILWNHRSDLARQGLLVPGQSLFDHNRAVTAIRHPTSQRRSHARARETWSRLLEEVADWPDDAILTNEWFVWADRVQAEQAVAALGNAEVHIVYTARSLVHQIPAAWQEQLKLGSGQSFEEFVVDLDKDHTNRWTWQALDPSLSLPCWTGSVPVDRVHVVTVPPRGADPITLWTRFCQVLDMDPGAVDTGSAAVNESLTAEAARLLQRVGPSLRVAIDADSAHWTEQYRWIRRSFAHDLLVPIAGHRIRVSHEHQRELGSRAASAVDHLRSTGYDIVGSLDDLLFAETPPDSIDPSEVTPEAELALATTLIADLLAQVRQLTLRAEALESTPEAPTTSPDRSLRRVTFLVFTADGADGVCRSVITLANALAARDHHVSIISLYRRRAKPTYPIDPRVTVTDLHDARPRQRDGQRRGGRVRAKDHPEHGRLAALLDARASRVAPTGDPDISLLTDLLLRRAIRSLEPGIVVSTRPSLHAAAIRFGAGRHVLVGQDHMNYQSRTQLPHVMRLLTDNVRRLDAFVSLTKHDLPLWSQHVDATTTVIEAIPNAVPWEPGPTSSLSSRTVVSAGRLIDRKGFIRLIDTWAPVALAHGDWQLHIYGKGTNEERIQKHVQRLGLTESVQLMGHSPHFDQVLEEAALFASGAHEEGFPMVMVEALSKGLPVVAYDIPTGPSDVIDDGDNGYLVRDHDSDGFTAGLLRIIEDDGLRARMGEASIHKARSFYSDNVAAQWESLFDRATSRHAESSSRPRDVRGRLRLR